MNDTPETPEENPLGKAVEQRRKDAKTQEYGTTAIVKLHIEVKCKSTWAGSATAQEVMETGGKEAIWAMENALKTAGVSFKHIRDPEIGLMTFHRSKSNG